MADFKKITGFQTPDGILHDTEKQAAEHVKNLKIKAAFQEFAEKVVMPSADEDGSVAREVIFRDDLAEFLFANRDAIAAALNPEIRTRAPRKDKGAKRTPKAKDTPKTEEATETPAPAETAAPASTPAPAVDPVTAALDDDLDSIAAELTSLEG